jgi:hypothetical protein
LAVVAQPMPSFQFLSLALDPGAILRAAGLSPDAWQEELLLSGDPHVLLNCSRQSGKSTVVAALALHTALFRDGSLTLILSPGLRQSCELFRKIIDSFNAVGRPLETTVENRTQLELETHSRIVCLPGREATIRGFSNPELLIVDEAARVPDDLYRSVRPMLAVGRGRLIALSTPFGQRGFFWKEWTDAAAAWKRVCVPADRCPRISADFLAAERQSMGESWVQQEYFCSFQALEGLVFPDLEKRCAVASGSPPSGRSVGGIDFGFRNPFCALWGVLGRDDVLWLDGEIYQRETPLPLLVGRLPRNVMWYADPAGATEISELRLAGLTVRRGSNDLRAGIAAVTARIETDRLRIDRVKCPHLLREAALYRYPTHPDGTAATEKPIDAHNHALAALRYLVLRIDRRFLARFRHRAAAVTFDSPLND